MSEGATRQEAHDFDLVETMRFDPNAGIDDLEDHLDRLRQSAEELGFRFDRHGARNELQAATFRHARPAMLRLMLSPKGSMAIELTAMPEPPRGPVAVTVRPLPVASDDIRLRHKSTARRFYDPVREEAGGFETVFVDSHGRITEGSFSNVFVERDGVLATPPAALGLVPGVLRARLIAQGKAVEAELTEADLRGGFLLGNSVRGLFAARLA